MARLANRPLYGVCYQTAGLAMFSIIRPSQVMRGSSSHGTLAR